MKIKERYGFILWILLMIISYIYGLVDNIADGILYGWFSLLAMGLIHMLVEKVTKREKPLTEEEVRSALARNKYLYGKLYYDKEEFGEALKSFDEATQNGFDEDDVYLLRAFCQNSLGPSLGDHNSLNQNAILDFSIYLLRHPNDCNTYYMRGMTRQRVGDNDGAVNDLEKAVTLSKENTKENQVLKQGALEMGWNSHTALYESYLKTVRSSKTTMEILIAHKNKDSL